MKTMRFELCVVGGGLSGVCFAVAAARNGCKTALVHDRPVLGGNSSSEVGVGPVGSQYYNVFAMETGIVDEILLRDRARNHSAPPDTARRNCVYDMTLYEICAEESLLTLFLNTSAEDTAVENAEIKTVKCRRKGGEPFLIEAVQFADCSGDGAIAYSAGADFRYGREDRTLHGESIAVEEADSGVMGSGVVLYVKNTGAPAPYKAPSFAVPYNDESFGSFRDPFLPRGDEFSYSGWLEIALPYHTVEDSHTIYNDLLGHIYGLWDYIKNVRYPSEARDYALEWVSPVIGNRESRRFLGDYILTMEDCLKDSAFYDAVSYGGWFVDEHTSGGLYAKELPPVTGINCPDFENYILVAPYSIPLRCLYSRNVGNLWLGGRIFSASHLALCSTRVQCTLALAAQSAGTAAAMAIDKGLTPRGMAMPEHVEEVRQNLLKDDVRILNCRDNDPADLCAAAVITASHRDTLGEIPPNGVWEELLLPRAQIFPLDGGFVDSVDVFLTNRSGEEITVAYKLEHIETLWQQDDGVAAVMGEITLRPGFEGYMPARVKTECTKGLYRIVIEGSKNVFWSRGKTQPHGTLAQYRYELKTPAVLSGRNVPCYRKYNQKPRDPFSHSIRINPAQDVYRPGEINNGCAWPYDYPNLWRSEATEPVLTVKFAAAKRVSEVILYPDVDLNKTHSRMPAFWTAPCCPRQIRVENGKGNLLAEWSGLPMHIIKLNFPVCYTQELRIILGNPEGGTVGLYGLRIYGGEK